MYLISGMHRSGTSLVAKLFYNSGADMGDAASFHAADEWNPSGYYEQRDIIKLNIAMLHGSRGKLAYIRLPSTDTILRRSSDFANRISHYGQLYADRIVKENRFCFTLPAWRAHGGDVRKVLICLREPVDAALSLRKRNKIPLWFGFRLWFIHLSRLLENAAGLDIWFVRYENLLKAATRLQETAGVFHFFGVEQSPENIIALLDASIRPELKNISGRLTYKYPGTVQTLWSHLLHRHAKQFQENSV